MNNEPSRDLETTDEAEATQDTPRQKRSGAGFIAGLALVLALGALALSTYREWRAVSAPETSWAGMAELQGLQSQVRADRAEVSALAERVDTLPEPQPGVPETRVERLEADLVTLRASQNQLRTLNESLQFAVDSLQARLAAAEGALEGAVAAPRQATAGRSALDEAQEYLQLAGERLEVFGDVAGADEMLLLADERLERLDDPRMMPVRRAIADSRADLADVPTPDVSGLERRVAALQAEVPGLPFAGDASSAAPQQEATEGWWARLKGSLSGLVTVRRETEASDIPLGLEDRDYIRQGLWLQLETARLALMRRDSQTWNGALGRAAESLAKWFEAAPAAVAIGDEIDALARVDVAPPMPDIGEARARLEIIVARRPVADPAPAPAGAGPPESQPESQPQPESPIGDAAAETGDDTPPVDNETSADAAPESGDEPE